jgi:hypothetical protein
MYRLLALATLAVRFSSVCPAQQPSPAAGEREVRQFLMDLVNASLKPDPLQLNRFYADEFVATNASGAVLNKAAVIGALTSGRLRFQSYEIEEVQVRMYGELAIIRDSERIESNTGSGRFRHLRVASKRDGHWQLIATQMTRIAEQ